MITAKTFSIFLTALFCSLFLITPAHAKPGVRYGNENAMITYDKITNQMNKQKNISVSSRYRNGEGSLETNQSTYNAKNNFYYSETKTIHNDNLLTKLSTPKYLYYYNYDLACWEKEKSPNGIYKSNLDLNIFVFKNLMDDLHVNWSQVSKRTIKANFFIINYPSIYGHYLISYDKKYRATKMTIVFYEKSKNKTQKNSSTLSFQYIKMSRPDTSTRCLANQ